MRFCLAPLLLVVAALAGCSGEAEDGVVDVAFIGDPADLADTGLRLSPAAQALRAAQAQGLVRFDEAGQLVPGLAERWIVTDDGSSYIFRIREYDLPGGERLTAQAVRDSLVRTRSALAGTTLGLDLAKIKDIRAMTGRVIEIRLDSPMPGLLQLLAQPELGLVVGKAPMGPMQALADPARSANRPPRVLLEPMSPEDRGLPIQPEWLETIRQVALYPVDARTAIDGFGEGRFDMVLGGTIVDLPLAGSGPLSRGNVRLDSVTGLLGLAIVEPRGFLAEAANREALAMAIDREALIQPFNIGGWTPTTRIVAPALAGDTGSLGERWADLSIEQRQAQARARVARWQAAEDTAPVVRIALPQGPGSEILFTGLERDFAAIGVRAVRARQGADADLELRDRVARYAGPLWFLNQFNCRVARRTCSPDADALVIDALSAPDPGREALLLAEAERALTATNLFIPIGPPIRWSMVRAGTPGFLENPASAHPLFPLSRAPI